MFKDITMGQYFPGDSVIHLLDPRTKLLALILYIAALFTAKSYVSYAVVLGFLLTVISLSTISLKTMLKGVKPLLIVIIFTAVLNLLFTGGDHVIVQIWRFKLTWEGVRTAFFMLMRLVMLIMGAFLLTYTTSPMALTDGLERLMNPLKKIRFPVHEMAMMMSIALRFIPTLVEETGKIINAQKARGADFETGSLLQRAKALLPIMVPLFVSAFRRADELAVAMESRCYHGGEGRTRMNQLVFQKRDWLALLACLILLAAVITLVVFGL